MKLEEVIEMNDPARYEGPVIRRPQTTNSNDFWFISPAHWKELQKQARETQGQARESALNNLRKREAAGRLMETDAGVEALIPCSWCAREPPLGVVCRVEKDNPGTCAYCKRHSKGGCNARMAHPPPTLAERCDAMQEELVTMREQFNARFAALEAGRGLELVEEGRKKRTRKRWRRVKRQNGEMRDEPTVLRTA